jgi:hypothetical protein
VTAGAEDERARKDARWARYQAESRRTQAKVWLTLSGLWVVNAVVWWLLPDAKALTQWLMTVVAVVQLASAPYWWRVLHRPLPPGPDGG